MRCPFCGDFDSKVVDSRRSEDGGSIRRRRECIACQRRFTTYETVENLPIIVVKRDGTRQSFDRNKILNAMVRAFDKRKVEMADLERIIVEKTAQFARRQRTWFRHQHPESLPVPGGISPDELLQRIAGWEDR